MNSLVVKSLQIALGLQAVIWLGTLLVVGFSMAILWWHVVVAALLLFGLLAIHRPLDALYGRAASILSGMNRPVPRNVCRAITSALAEHEQRIESQNRQLGESRERFEAVLSGMAEGVIAIDASGDVLLVNRAARDLLALHPVTAVGRPLVGLVRYEPVQSAIRQAIHSEKTVHTQFETLGSERRQITLRVAPMSGAPMPGMTLVFRDVTELNRLEAIRRDFVANVSHELKSPLASIKAYAETLRLGAVERSPENYQFVKQIENQANLLNSQIHDLLQIARIESGHQSQHQEWVDLEQASEDCIDRFRREAEMKAIRVNLEIAKDLQGDPILVWIDPESIITILDNLVSNALRYTGQNGDVKIILDDVANGFAVFKVQDNGIGIAPEHQERVFERFFRVDQARSRDLGGTGLGLAIVKHTVHQADGKIELHSKIGVGTTFRVSLPVNEPATPGNSELAEEKNHGEKNYGEKNHGEKNHGEKNHGDLNRAAAD